MDQDLLIATRHFSTPILALHSFAGLVVKYRNGYTCTFVLDPNDKNVSMVTQSESNQNYQTKIVYNWIGKLITDFLPSKSEIQPADVEIDAIQVFRIHWCFYQTAVLEEDRFIYGELLASRETKRGLEYLGIEHISGPRLEDWQFLIDYIVGGRLAELFLRIPVKLTPDVEEAAKSLPTYLPHPGNAPQDAGEPGFIETVRRSKENTRRNISPVLM